MPFQELRELLVQVIISWQVLAVTVVVVLYLFLVSYVSALYRRPRAPSMSKRKRMLPSINVGRLLPKRKAKTEPALEGATDEDELGLEKE